MKEIFKKSDKLWNDAGEKSDKLWDDTSKQSDELWKGADPLWEKIEQAIREVFKQNPKLATLVEEDPGFEKLCKGMIHVHYRAKAIFWLWIVKVPGHTKTLPPYSAGPTPMGV